jgi:hypothetical protein
MLDFNSADRQSNGFDLIPNGTLVRVIGTIKPGGVSRPGLEAVDGAYLTASRSSDVLMLAFEFTVTAGPFARRKFWQNMGVSGGQLNEKGESKSWNITKSTLRAMLNSARNVMPDDEGERAKTARCIRAWQDLEGIEFAAKIRLNPEKNGY